jgi:hypothetical protein
MAEEKMIIEIGEDGEISVDLQGFRGKGCAAVMDIIEEALGPAKRKNKPEYSAKPMARARSSSRLTAGA